jgi:hypothetical protein
MIRTTLDQAYIKRSLRPLYGWTQTTPKAMYLDPAYDRSTDPEIFPGMVMMRGATGDTVNLIDATGFPLGLAAHFIGGYDIDELLDAGINAFAVWVLGPDAEFEVDAPAFDDSLVWTDPTDGTELLIHAQTAGATRGKLVPAGTVGASTDPVARLVKVNSDTTLTIGGLPVRA